jgi:hypothetical protein
MSKTISDCAKWDVGEKGPPIDNIEVAEFKSHAALKEWLSKKAPASFESCREESRRSAHEVRGGGQDDPQV